MIYYFLSFYFILRIRRKLKLRCFELLRVALSVKQANEYGIGISSCQPCVRFHIVSTWVMGLHPFKISKISRSGVVSDRVLSRIQIQNYRTRLCQTRRRPAPVPGVPVLINTPLLATIKIAGSPGKILPPKPRESNFSSLPSHVIIRAQEFSFPKL